MKHRIATALLADELPDDVFDDVAAMLDSGRIPRLDAAAMKKLIGHTHIWIDRHPPRAYSLARFGVLAAPLIPARKAADRAEREFLIAEAYREYAAACVARRFINEAAGAVIEAKRRYRSPEIAPFVRAEPVLVELNAAWVMFYQDAVPLSLREMDRLSKKFLDEFHDERRYTIVRQYIAAIQMQTGRAQEALTVLLEVFNLTIERGWTNAHAAITHNVAGCMKLLGDACPPHLVERARELVEEHIEGHAPRSGYILAEQLKKEGKSSEAISELYKVRAEFQARGDDIIAAATVRGIVELLIPAGRDTEAHFIGEVAIEELESAGMLLEARRIRELLGGPEQRRRTG